MSLRSNGSYIGYNRVTTTSQDSASGIWSLAAAERRRRADAWPGAFLPSNVTGLQLWLDASAASTLYDATSGGSLVAADGSVARWEDKSGNARHATQSTSANRPLRKTAIQGGKDVLRFDGSNDVLTYSLTLGTSATFFLVTTPSTSNDAYIIGSTHQNGSPTFLSRYTNNGSRRDYEWYLPEDREIMATTQAGFSVIAATHQDAGSMFAYINGSQVATKSVTASINQRVMSAIGAANAAAQSPAGVDIGEFLVYNSVLSAENRTAVTDYLKAKWSIA